MTRVLKLTALNRPLPQTVLTCRILDDTKIVVSEPFFKKMFERLFSIGGKSRMDGRALDNRAVPGFRMAPNL